MGGRVSAVQRGAPSLCEMLDPEVLADPYPLYRRLREHDPVAWDPYLHSWVVTDYADVVTVLQKFSANRTPTPDQLRALGLADLAPMAEVMVRQMLFLDAPAHTRLRSLCSTAFAPRQIEGLADRIKQIADELIEQLPPTGRLDLISAIAAPLPAIVTAELLGLPRADHVQLKQWSADFAEVLGNLQHNPDRAASMTRSLGDMLTYFRSAIRQRERNPCPGLIQTLMDAKVDTQRLSEDEVIANVIVTMVGGQETTTNLIGNGILTLLRHPQALCEMRDQPDILESAVEDLLRFESPSQHTARLVAEDTVLGGKELRRGESVIAVMAAANRDPKRFPNPDQLDLRRPDNRHLSFGWAAHFCFGAPLARLESRITFAALLRRLPGITLCSSELLWRENLGLRGLDSLELSYRRAAQGSAPFQKLAAL